MISDLAGRLKDTLRAEHQPREMLCAKLNCNDRALRFAATELKMVGFNICSSSRETGYWLGTPEEMEALAKEYDSRAMKNLRIAQAIRRGPDLGQMEGEV